MKERSMLPLIILMILVILFVAAFSTKIFGEPKPERAARSLRNVDGPS